MKKNHNLLWVLGVSFLILIFLELCIWFFHVPFYIFPSPSQVLGYLFQNYSLFFPHFIITAIETVLGVIIAFIIGIFFGGVFLYSRTMERIFFPFIFLLQIIPLVAIGPILILWLGFGLASKIWVVAIFALYPILSFFKMGVQNIPSEVLITVKLLRVNYRTLFSRILFPHCFLHACLGLKIALTYSVTCAIFAEVLGAQMGLGIIIMKSIASFNILALFSSIYLVILLSIFLYTAAWLLEKQWLNKIGIRMV